MDYYIDPAGNNANVGTAPGAGTAWRDLSHALANSGDGDTINCAAGIYPSDSGYDLTDRRTILGPNAGIPYDGVRSAEAVLSLNGALKFMPGSDGSIIDGLEMDASGNSARVLSTALGEEANDVKILNNRIHDGVQCITVLVAPDGEGVCSGWVIDGNLIDSFADFGIFIDPHSGSPKRTKVVDFLIKDNRIGNIAGSHGIVAVGFENLGIIDNVIQNCTRAIELKGGLNVTVRPSCIVHGNTLVSGADTPRYLLSVGVADDLVQIDDSMVISDNVFTWESDLGDLWYMLNCENVAGVFISGNGFGTTGSSVASSPCMQFSDLKEGKYRIEDNSIVGGPPAAISTAILFSALLIEDRCDIAVERNQIVGYRRDVRVTVGDIPGNVNFRVKGNEFSGSTAGVENTDGAVIDARDNYWNDPSGPSGGVADPVTGKLANGSGSEVSTNVRWDEFYETPTMVVLRHNSPFLRDATLTVEPLGGLQVRLIYDIRAKCKWDTVLDYTDVAALQSALEAIRTLARKSLRPRLPSPIYDKHVEDIETFITNL